MAESTPMAEVVFWLTKAKGPYPALQLHELYGKQATDRAIQALMAEGYGIHTELGPEGITYELTSSPQHHPGQLTMEGE